jgi:hypothetical protein
MPVEPQPPLEAAAEKPVSTWYQKMGALLFVIFCFEVGVFLLVVPWLDFWERNSLADLLPWLRGYWDNPYFRGALSGLGVINIYISFVEVFRLRRFSAY